MWRTSSSASSQTATRWTVSCSPRPSWTRCAVCAHSAPRLSVHPLARETVPAFLTFDEAKYKLGPSVSVAAGLDGRPNLGTMPWADFEQLVRELLLAMQGHDTRVTRGSRDDGIDGVVFDCHAALGGEYIVQAKRDHFDLDVLVPQPPRRRSSSPGGQEDA